MDLDQVFEECRVFLLPIHVSDHFTRVSNIASLKEINKKKRKTCLHCYCTKSGDVFPSRLFIFSLFQNMIPTKIPRQILGIFKILEEFSTFVQL